MVPIVSKKSLSMIENVTRTAATTPSRATTPRSSRPKVEKSGHCTRAVGTVAAPGVGNPFHSATTPLRTMASTVVPTIPMSRAPRTRRAMSQAVRRKPTTNTTAGGVSNVPRPTGSGLLSGLTTKPAVRISPASIRFNTDTLISRGVLAVNSFAGVAS